MTDAPDYMPKTTKPDTEAASVPVKSQVVRLSAEHSEKLNKLSGTFGVPQAQLMRWALDALFAKVESCGGKLVLPLVFGPNDGDQGSPLHLLASPDSAKD